jgi:parvulin-like peptidyl-prolyl isomerase
MLGHRLEDHSEPEIAGFLGQDFATALAEIPQGQWDGPLESAFGLHLVYVESRVPSRVPPLAEIRGRVLDEYRSARQREANEAVYQALRERYEIVVETGDDLVDADLAASLP